MRWTRIAQFDQPLEAHLARGRLEAAQIPVRVADEHLVANDWLLSGALGGIKLSVPAEHAETARALLDEIDATAKLADETPTCPHCGSTRIEARRESWAFNVVAVAAVLLTAGLALFLKRPRFTCRACGRQWG